MGSSKAVQDWYANRLREHYAARSHAHRKGDDAGDIYPAAIELSPAATRADPAGLPKPVLDAHEFYQTHFADADLGSVRGYVVPVAGKTTYAIRVRTDGDDGYLEVYDERGKVLAAGRTYLEVVAWGSRAWLRAQVARPGELPPEPGELEPPAPAVSPVPSS